MRRFVCAIVLLSLAGSGYGQILENDKGQVFSDDPYFDQDYIFNNNIKRIEGQLWVKAEGDRMRKRADKIIFTFNENGYLRSQLEIKNKDTTAIFYKYNAKGYLLSKSESDRKGFLTEYYSYDEQNRVKKIAFHRENNRHPYFNQYIPTNSNQMSLQTMKYEQNEDSLKSFLTVYNTNNKPYKRIRKTYHPLGYLLEENVNYFIGSGYEKTAYEYNHEGLLVTVHKEVKITNKKTYEYRYQYDEHQNIELMETYVNGELKSKQEAVYDWENYELKAFIINDQTLNFFKIYRLTVYRN